MLVWHLHSLECLFQFSKVARGRSPAAGAMFLPFMLNQISCRHEFQRVARVPAAQAQRNSQQHTRWNDRKDAWRCNSGPRTVIADSNRTLALCDVFSWSQQAVRREAV